MRLTALTAVLMFILISPVHAQELECETCLVYQPTICTPSVLGSVDIAEETAGYSIDIEYPVLCSATATRIIRDHVTRSLSDFKMDFPEHDLTDYRHKHQMLTEFQAWEAGKGRLASVKLLVMVYTGGAHPNNWPVTWVFDMTNGGQVGLDDIFINERDALIDISDTVRSVLRESLGQMAIDSMLLPGSTPVAGNYDDFIVNDEGLAFFFAPYQVAPYAAGQQVVTIPWQALDKHIRPEFKAMIQ